MTSDKNSPTGEQKRSALPVQVSRVIASEELLKGQQEVLIQHGSKTYRLRVTRNGKLILHK